MVVAGSHMDSRADLPRRRGARGAALVGGGVLFGPRCTPQTVASRPGRRGRGDLAKSHELAAPCGPGGLGAPPGCARRSQAGDDDVWPMGATAHGAGLI